MVSGARSHQQDLKRHQMRASEICGQAQFLRENPLEVPLNYGTNRVSVKQPIGILHFDKPNALYPR
jgi:hypothetical protein